MIHAERSWTKGGSRENNIFALSSYSSSSSCGGGVHQEMKINSPTEIGSDSHSHVHKKTNMPDFAL